MFERIKNYIGKILISKNLTLEDLLIINQRGFLVKKNFSAKNLMILTIKLIIYASFIFSVTIGIASTIMIIGMALFENLFSIQSGVISNAASYISLPIFIVGIYFILKGILWYLYDYVRSGFTFYHKSGTISFGEISPFGFIKKQNRGMLLLDNFYLKITSPHPSGARDYFYITLLIGLLIIFLIKWWIYLLSGLTIWIILVFLARTIFQSFHPLYAFGNLGEKIQKLTPEIEKKSKIIQENFKSDMNFKILSEGFDSLSSTFSEIVSLVIKLEHVEKRANKGNLFDSEKYINSLRSDILEPLKSLKSFHEKQKEELLLSQKELKQIQLQGADPSLRSGGQRVRVRVGGRDPEIHSGGQEHSKGQSNGGLGHAELSSKRSEPIIAELTENIERLDEMIGKI